MWYVGSKSRLAKDIVPIIQSYITDDTECYIEPFVGGANIIDKIKCKKKIGSDYNKYLIELLNYSKNGVIQDFITEEEYNTVKANKERYADWYIGLVGFCATYSAKFWGTYSRRYDKDGNQIDVSGQAIRAFKKQAMREEFLNTIFLYRDYLEIKDVKNCVIYCDIPYRDKLKYKGIYFDHTDFYRWARDMSKNNIVIVSEYFMPNDFSVIYEKESKCFLNNGSSNNTPLLTKEKLYILDNRVKKEED